MTITASLVKELRERTSVGMMECKKALEESNGDIEAAITLMRKSGQAKAAKKGGRVAAEGIVIVKTSSDNQKAAIVEVNCETDFAARDTNFLEFANKIAIKALESEAANLEKLSTVQFEGSKFLNDLREDLIGKIGENIGVRRVGFIAVSKGSSIASYVHGNGRIGVIVGLSVTDPELGKDIAMHIAATNPIAISPETFPSDLVAKEKEIFMAQLQDSNKPQEILDKIISGKVEKFISESVLIKQPFVKNPDITVEQLLKQAKAEVLGFIRFAVGEGVEKKETDFAAEVQAQVNANK